MTVPILAVHPLPCPPGWDLFSQKVRREYVDELADRGVRVDWPTDDRSETG